MLTVEKYNNFLDCLYTLDDTYMYSDDYRVYAKNHDKYKRIQFMIRDYPCLKELKDAWSNLRNENDKTTKELLRTYIHEVQSKILESLPAPEESCNV